MTPIDALELLYDAAVDGETLEVIEKCTKAVTLLRSHLYETPLDSNLEAMHSLFKWVEAGSGMDKRCLVISNGDGYWDVRVRRAEERRGGYNHNFQRLEFHEAAALALTVTAANDEFINRKW